MKTQSKVLILCIFGALGVSFAENFVSAQETPIAITDVSIVDVIDGGVLPAMSVVISDGKIRQVGRANELQIPPGARQIDGRGKYAMPGLWDMHIHWYHSESMKLFPINGVTGVRLMWGSGLHHSWRKKFESGEMLGPRLLIGSTIIDGPSAIWPGSIIAKDAAGGIAAVEKAIKGESDFAKVYSLLSREASEAGQRSMEHLYEIVISCSANEADLRKLQQDALGDDGKVRDYFNNRPLAEKISQTAFDSYDEARAQELFALLAANETWQCPTLTVLRNLAHLTDPEVQNNPHLKYLPERLATSIAPQNDPYRRNEAARKRAQKRFRKHLAILLEMRRAGVPILAGTDCLNPFCLPGFSLHGEMKLMVDAGLSPIDALRAATINPAKFQRQEDVMGSISSGKVADIVLLNENPLADIAHTTSIDSVIIRGQLLERAKLDEMLNKMNREADEVECE